eukprot:scaffold469428_cov28-Prasinocladus_malaysianus.AAC.1
MREYIATARRFGTTIPYSGVGVGTRTRTRKCQVRWYGTDYGRLIIYYDTYSYRTITHLSSSASTGTGRSRDNPFAA